MWSRPPLRPLKGFTLLCVEVAYELLQKWFNSSCCNFSYSARTSQILDLDLILEASSLILEGSQVFFLQFSLLLPISFLSSHLRPWTSHLWSTPLPDLHSLFTGLFVLWGWQPSRVGILAAWQGCQMSPSLWNYSACVWAASWHLSPELRHLFSLFWRRANQLSFSSRAGQARR